MTTIALTRRQLREAHGTNTLVSTLTAIARGLAQRAKIRHDRRLLQTMSDHLLADMGISRSEIDHATAFGRGR